MAYVLISYLHWIGIILVFSSVTLEHILIKDKMTLKEAKTLSVADLLYGIGAVIVLTSGLLKMFDFGKGLGYYMSNHIFYTKLTLFGIIGILSIYPSIMISRWKKIAKKEGEIELDKKQHKKVLMMFRVELLLLALIPLLASMVANGISAGS